MKWHVIRCALGALFLALLLSLSGCLLLAASVGAAGGILGYTYFDNGVEGNFDKPVPVVAKAARQACKDVGVVFTSDMTGETSFRFEGKGFANDTVVVEGQRAGENVTAVKITIGTFESQDSQSKAAQLYGKIQSHL